LLLVSVNALADTSNKTTMFVDLHMTSFHSQENYYEDYETDEGTKTTTIPFNEENFGIGVRYQLEDFLDVSVGFFKNSFYNTSVYLGGEVYTSRQRLISIGLAVGLVSGYRGTTIDTPVMVMPIMQVGVPEIGVRIGVVPFGVVPFATVSLYAGF